MSKKENFYQQKSNEQESSQNNRPKPATPQNDNTIATLEHYNENSPIDNQDKK